MPEWIVSRPDRLDSFLASREGVLSRTKAQKAIEDGRVDVNDVTVTKTAQRIQEGDKVVLRDDESPVIDSPITPVDLHLNLLYEDDDCFVIDKPAGIAVHPGAGMAPGEKTILNGIAYLYGQWSVPFSGALRQAQGDTPFLVHRLDKETTGCLLIAKNPAAHLALQKQFETRTVEKKYLALVAGVPSPAAAKIDAPIGRSYTDRTKMDIMRIGASREAQTTYRTLAVSAARRAALLECELHTGRTHQIRVHLSSINHPVLGDGTYTNELSDRIKQEFDIQILCLHAWKLKFVSPADQREHAIMATLPYAFREALQRVKVEWNDD